MAHLSVYLDELKKLDGDWKPEDHSKMLMIPERRLCVAGDVHIPYHNRKLIAEMFQRCCDQSIEALVFLGDLMDNPNFSHWGVEDKTTRFTKELEIVRGMVDIALQVAPTVYWSAGNHEERWMRAMNYNAGMLQLARMAGLGDAVDTGHLILSDHPSLEADEGRWLLTHPAQYGSTPLVVPGKLAGIHEKNVMSAHAHHFAMGTDPTGKYVVVETGGLFQPEQHRYIQHRVTAHRRWQAGYWTLIDGVAAGYRGADVLR
jgi:predicted phosphodiesterase